MHSFVDLDVILTVTKAIEVLATVHRDSSCASVKRIVRAAPEDPVPGIPRTSGCRTEPRACRRARSQQDVGHREAQRLFTVPHCWGRACAQGWGCPPRRCGAGSPSAGSFVDGCVLLHAKSVADLVTADHRRSFSRRAAMWPALLAKACRRELVIMIKRGPEGGGGHCGVLRRSLAHRDPFAVQRRRRVGLGRRLDHDVLERRGITDLLGITVGAAPSRVHARSPRLATLGPRLRPSPCGARLSWTAETFKEPPSRLAATRGRPGSFGGQSDSKSPAAFAAARIGINPPSPSWARASASLTFVGISAVAIGWGCSVT